MEPVNISDILVDAEQDYKNDTGFLYADPMAASGFTNNTYSDSEMMGHMINEEFKWACVGFYCAIFFLSMIGNGMFCYVVVSSRAMSAVTYRLLVNLSVSDLMITCLCGPMHVVQSLLIGHWPFGAIGCYSFSYLQGVSVLVSSYTLVVISFERYMSILHPLRQVIPIGNARWCIFAIWFVSCLLSIPTPIGTQHLQVMKVWVCTNELTTTFHYYSLALCICQYFLPLILMSFFYSMVAATIWKRRDIGQVQVQTHKINRQMAMLNGKRKMIKMLMVVVICYTFCWLPFNIYWVLGLAEPTILDHWTFPYVFTTVHLLALSHTFFNPVIYCWMNSRVRYGFMDVFGKSKLVRRCLPNVDWDNRRLTRAAIPSQNTEIRRNNTSARPLGLRRNQRNPDVDDYSEIVGRPSPMYLRADYDDHQRSLRVPKTSTVSHNYEMAELLSMEPLMQPKQNMIGRQSKISVTSNMTQLTQITDSSESGSSHYILDNISLRQTDSFKSRSQFRVNSVKGLEKQRSEIADITEEQSSESNGLSPLHVTSPKIASVDPEVKSAEDSPDEDSSSNKKKFLPLESGTFCAFHQRKSGSVNCTLNLKIDLDKNLNPTGKTHQESSVKLNRLADLLSDKDNFGHETNDVHPNNERLDCNQPVKVT